MSPATPGPGFEVRVDGAAESIPCVAVSGELDSATSTELVQVCQGLLARGPEKLVLDLRGLTFVDSAGTRGLILLQREAGERGVALEMLPAPEEVTALLRLAGVADRMNVVSASPDGSGDEFLERMDLELARQPTSPAMARAEVRQAVGPMVDHAELATLVLLTSELVTNAVIHPRGTDDRRLGLRLTVYPDRVRVEVDDPGDGFDASRPLQPTESGGRGLIVVNGASTRWGAASASTARGDRFTVWFELELQQPVAQAVGG